LGIRIDIRHWNSRQGIEHASMPRAPGPQPDANEDHHEEHGDDPGEVAPGAAHGVLTVSDGAFGACGLFRIPSPCRYATMASSSLLPASASGAPAMSSSL